MKRNTLANAVMASLLTSVILSQASVATAATSMEKCYGVAKAGKNDCGTKTHACSAQAKSNNEADEWIFVPEGTCDKITGGSTSEAQ